MGGRRGMFGAILGNGARGQTKKSMKKTAAIKHARKNVGQIYSFGTGYAFNYNTQGWTRECQRGTYYEAFRERQRSLIEAARLAMGVEQIDAYSMWEHGDGSWTANI